MNDEAGRPAAARGHLDTAALLDHLEQGPAGAGSGAAAHLARCARCRNALAAVAELTRSIRGAGLESPPEWLTHWAAELPRQHPRRVARPVIPDLRLVLDSWALRPAGVRGAARSSRRLVYRAGSIDLDVELELAPTGRTAVVQGQILDAAVPGGRTFVGGEVRLVSGRRTMARGPLEARGDFRLAGVPRDSYGLVIAAEGFRIRVSAFEV